MVACTSPRTASSPGLAALRQVHWDHHLHPQPISAAFVTQPPRSSAVLGEAHHFQRFTSQEQRMNFLETGLLLPEPRMLWFRV